MSHESRKPSGRVSQIMNEINDDVDDDDGSSIGWMNRIPNPVDDSSSDGIEFVNSNGDIIESDDDCEDEKTIDVTETMKSKPIVQFMYIQMEFCEKSTLR